MIIRISGEGQYRLSDDAQAQINQLDAELEAALDTDAFPAALAALIEAVRTIGEAVPGDAVLGVDVVLPPADASAAEVRGMLADDGLIPG